MPVFVLECFLAMVFALVGDVLPHGFDIGFGYSEGTVACLPCECREFRALGFDPFRRRFFDIFDGFADGCGAPEVEQEVDVVFDGIDENGRGTQVLKDGGHVGVELGADVVGDEIFAVFGAEDQVDVEAGEGLWHRIGRPFRAG